MDDAPPAHSASDRLEQLRRSIRRRRRAERRFRIYGVVAVSVGILTVTLLFADIAAKGWSAFLLTHLRLELRLAPDLVDPQGDRSPESLAQGDYARIIKAALRARFPEVRKRRDKRALYRLVSSAAPYVLRDRLLEHPDWIGKTVSVWLPASDDVDMWMKGQLGPESERLSAKQRAWLALLDEHGDLRKRWNGFFLTQGDSRQPEVAGIAAAVSGSFFTLLVTLLLSFPIGVAAAVYLEEFAPKSRLTDLIEVNINNLAAVPSIVFGLLGLAVFIQFFGVPRSTPLVGGLVLALMTLPTIIVASRAALQSVPPSIRDAALALGASRMQTVGHHVLPLAMSGVLTGTIIGMARALGETAPLLMIGMVAFIVDIPKGPLDPATVLPVQIYLWADAAERAYVEKSSAAIMVLLVFLLLMNLTAILLRRRFEQRW